MVDQSQQLGRKSAALLASALLCSAKLVEWPGLLESEFWEYARRIPWQLVLVTVAAEKSVADMWKWHWSS